MYERRSKDRDTRPFSERPDGTNMVSVVMGNEDSENVTEVESNGAQMPMDGSCRNAGIDEYAAAFCP